MLKYLRNSLIASFILLFLLTFFGLQFLQKSNNALPFFYKDYPTYEVNGKKRFDSVSESLVLNRIDFSTLNIDYGYKFNLWRSNQEKRSFSNFRTNINYNFDYITTPNYLLDGQPYRSQIGIQSLFWAKLANILNIKHGEYLLLKMISVLLLSLSAALALIWIKIKFGIIPAFFSLSFFILSTGINVFSQSLYWSIWLFILPVGTVCLLDIIDIKNKYVIFLLMTPVFLIKLLAGYEFISVIVLAAITPYIWSYLMNENLCAAWKAVSVIISSIFSFLLSILIYNQCFYYDFKSSGIDHILGRGSSWSLKNLAEQSINPWTQSAKILIMNFIDLNGYGIPFIIFLLSILVVMILIRNKIRLRQIAFMLFLFFSSFSWLLIQPGHLLFHPRYAMLIFFIPFGFFGVGFIADLTFSKDNQRKKTDV